MTKPSADTDLKVAFWNYVV